jgi:hypothetical protein
LGQLPRGENRGVEHRAAAFVDQTKPAHMIIMFNSYMFFGIHLPGLVGRGGALGFDSRPPARWRRGEVGPRQPPAQRPRRGNRSRRVGFEELHSDELCPPGGVLTAEVDGGPHTSGRCEVVPRPVIPRRHPRDAVEPESLEQAIDRRARDPEPLGELRGVPSLLPEPKHDLTDWDWDRARHSRTSQDQDSDKRRIAP